MHTCSFLWEGNYSLVHSYYTKMSQTNLAICKVTNKLISLGCPVLVFLYSSLELFPPGRVRRIIFINENNLESVHENAFECDRRFSQLYVDCFYSCSIGICTFLYLISHIIYYTPHIIQGTLADLEISLYVRVRRKIIPWKFRILNPWNSQVIYP